MTNLLDPKLDFVFKNIFGKEESKPVLISFLNALLKGNPTIKSLILENTDITKILEDDKASRMDIKATCDNGTKLDIEIQIKNTGEIPQRAFHYLANMMPHTVKANESYKGPNVIGIWILGENVTDRQDAISEAYMTFQPSDHDPYQIMTDSARIFFIELPKFKPKSADMHDLLTGWLSFLKDPIFMDKSFLKVSEVSQAMGTLEYISADDEMRAIADLRQKTINDYNSSMTVARENGLKEGLAKGKAEGLAEGIKEGLAKGEAKGLAEGEAKGEFKKAQEAAKSMLLDGMSAASVSKYTGLSEEEVISLQKSIK